jgi:hypothetical protein
MRAALEDPHWFVRQAAVECIDQLPEDEKEHALRWRCSIRIVSGA